MEKVGGRSRIVHGCSLPRGGDVVTRVLSYLRVKFYFE